MAAPNMLQKAMKPWKSLRFYGWNWQVFFLVLFTGLDSLGLALKFSSVKSSETGPGKTAWTRDEVKHLADRMKDLLPASVLALVSSPEWQGGDVIQLERK